METQPPLIDSGPAFEAAGLVHRVREGSGFGPFPTVVMLHGWKGNEDVMWIFANSLPREWLLVAPRAILPDPEGGFSWYPHHEQTGWPELSRFDDAVVATKQFIDALPDLYDADPDGIYLMGFSQGVATSLATAMRYPGLAQGIAALVGFAPRGYEAVAEQAPFLEMPIFVAAGTQDERIPMPIAEEMVAMLKAAGAELTYHVYETGHRLNGAGMRALRAWWASIY